MKKENSKKKNDNIEVKFNINKTKLLKGIGVVVAVLLIIGLAFFVSNSYEGGPVFEFTNITIDEYLEKLAGSEKSIIYVARPSCSYCQMEKPIITKLGGQYDLEIFYLNTETFYDSNIQDYTEDGYKLINSAPEYADGIGTPNTIIVQNGEIVDGIFQYVEASELKDLFERNGFLDE